MKVIIIGAGPAGLTTAYTILKNNTNCEVVILESDNMVGGISKTITYNNNKMDLGGHRFFSKSEVINDLWKELLPIQGKQSIDDKLTGNTKPVLKKGPNPEKEDRVFLIRNRVSRIYYNRKFFDYPVSLTFKTIKLMGVKNTMIVGFSYLKSIFIKKKEVNLENFYINRFGKKLYEMFFRDYTEKLWGRKPSEIDASWGKQRVKGLSIIKLISSYLKKVFRIKEKSKETSLIESFYYPKYGPGEMWDEMKNEIEKMGGKILFGYNVVKIKKQKNTIQSVVCEHNNKKETIEGDVFVSSMPIKDLISGLNNVSQNVKKIALGLPYRDFMTIGLILKKINLNNNTNMKTVNNILPDCWIYVQESDVKMGRIQIFNNWSPYLVSDFKNTISLGLEYFCNENDDLWNLDDSKFKELAVKELIDMNIVDSEKDVVDYHVERVKKAYPAYFDTYDDFDVVKKYLLSIDNLYCVGRNGQHRYNNMDHSMETGILAAQNILGIKNNKEEIWNVNCEEEYHEAKIEKVNSKN